MCALLSSVLNLHGANKRGLCRVRCWARRVQGREWRGTDAVRANRREWGVPDLQHRVWDDNGEHDYRGLRRRQQREAVHSLPGVVQLVRDPELQRRKHDRPGAVLRVPPWVRAHEHGQVCAGVSCGDGAKWREVCR